VKNKAKTAYVFA